MELLKDYDCTIICHSSKANVVANGLSRKSMESLAHIASARRLLVEEIHKLKYGGVHFELGSPRLLLAHVQAQYALIEQIKAIQYKDPKLCKLMEDFRTRKSQSFPSTK